eukprot:XP_001707159.1 Hypothetical protein GL50803_34578 [Giardia lamblia ATCC 50803]
MMQCIYCGWPKIVRVNEYGCPVLPGLTQCIQIFYKAGKHALIALIAGLDNLRNVREGLLRNPSNPC